MNHLFYDHGLSGKTSAEGAKLEDLKHTQDAASPGTFFLSPEKGRMARATWRGNSR